MSEESFVIRLEEAGDCPEIERLNDAAFGPGRFARTAYRLREGVAHDPTLSFVAIWRGGLVGSVRLTPIAIGAFDALLLGPLAVHPCAANRGIGRRLVRVAVEEARAQGHRLVLLVGDLSYYGPLGFSPVWQNAITLPGPVDPGRVLAARINDEAHEICGEARRIVPRG